MQRRTLLQSLAASALVLGCGGKDTEDTAAVDTEDTDTDTETGNDTDSSIDTGPDTLDCEISPEQIAGPFYMEDVEIRQDITEGKEGVLVNVTLTVTDVKTCLPLVGAVVVLWQADATGTYSGFAEQGTKGESYLRGGQISDENGQVSFTTIYPGFYPGRTAHFHVSARPKGRDEQITQLYFPADINASVAATYGVTSPTTNSADGYYDDVLEMTVSSDGKGYSAQAELTL